MENEKLEKQKANESKMENISGGFSVNVNTCGEAPATMNALYVNEREYGALIGSGAVGKDKKLHEHDVNRALEALFAANGYDASQLDSKEDLAKAFSKMHLLSRKKKFREIKIDLVQ